MLQDRRKFGPLGFNIRYEFTTGDLKCCIMQLEIFIQRYEQVPYTVLVQAYHRIA
jgi:dynein heavy chain